MDKDRVAGSTPRQYSGSTSSSSSAPFSNISEPRWPIVRFLLKGSGQDEAKERV